MTDTTPTKAQKRINVNLLNEEAEAFEKFKEALEAETGFSGLSHTAVIKWLINNNKLTE